MHNYLETLRRAIPFLDRGKGSLPRGEILALKPQRNREVAWEMKAEEDGEAAGAKLTVPRRDDRAGQLISLIFRIPASRSIELDEFGAQVWARCDGQHSVDQLIKFTCETYKLNRRQGEVSVVTFMKMLAQRRLIGFPQGTPKPNSAAGKPAAGKQTEGKGTGHVHSWKRPAAGANQTPAAALKRRSICPGARRFRLR